MREDRLISRARARFWFGWGKWGVATVNAPLGQFGTVRDSMWIIAFGDHGWFGLGSFFLLLLLPTLTVWQRKPLAEWAEPEVAPAGLLGLIVALFAIDCCFNAMPNPAYLLAAGAVLGFASAQPVPARSSEA